MTFATVEAYLDFWRVHPALAGRWNPFAERGAAPTTSSVTPPALRSSVREEAVLADMAEQLTSDDIDAVVAALAHPTRLRGRREGSWTRCRRSTHPSRSPAGRRPCPPCAPRWCPT